MGKKEFPARRNEGTYLHNENRLIDGIDCVTLHMYQNSSGFTMNFILCKLNLTKPDLVKFANFS
jgi:hypothetical protein